MSAQLARLIIDSDRTISPISPLLFGGFAEHLGRCIYEGIYEPDSPLADADGLRSDVRSALDELGYTIMRYPGGNFVSGYDWQDGVGPKDKRPARRDLAWMSVESNQFGTDEFLQFCRKMKTEPMMGLNFGTGDISSAANLVEYCNAPEGTKWADLRKANGHADPYGVKYWCLGNEMDGSWQIAHLSANDYAKKAREAAKMMRWMDPSIETFLCGSSGSFMGSFPEWDRTILEACWDQTNYLSLHHYVTNDENDTDSFLAKTVVLERHVDVLSATLRYVKEKLRSKKDVYLAWDEWNVWYKDRTMDGKWQQAPHLLEEIYNLEDALVVAQWMNVFLNKSDVLKVACVAQIVNVIAPILTRPPNQLVRQTIFYPFMLFRRLATGLAMDVVVKSPTYSTKLFGDVPVLHASASQDAATGRGAVFVVNRSQTESVTVEIEWRAMSPTRVGSIHQISGSDPKAGNSFDNPRQVVPRTFDGGLIQNGKFTLTLPPLSFTALEIV